MAGADEMRVRFLEAFDWTPPDRRMVTLAFAAGQEATVTRRCGEEAVRAGKAEEIAPPKRQAKADAEA
ncbi:hypothetical protein Q0812_13360 [Brevundimonas sp. 2R-24]|uniref:Uncharacterized protein n=1 Tax=Peiella sedimenti TaxID=3061083 RepID=A0ABT8SPB3_9CAUL|nr:hypothetical protein [Caulobacteraceae bacterium XZ-24]